MYRKFHSKHVKRAPQWQRTQALRKLTWRLRGDREMSPYEGFSGLHRQYNRPLRARSLREVLHSAPGEARRWGIGTYEFVTPYSVLREILFLARNKLAGAFHVW